MIFYREGAIRDIAEAARWYRRRRPSQMVARIKRTRRVRERLHIAREVLESPVVALASAVLRGGPLAMKDTGVVVPCAAAEVTAWLAAGAPDH
jgi:hypothetical protein